MTDLILREPWTDPERQRVAVAFGVWTFVATEALFFGGLFFFYAIARWSGGAGFIAGAHEADIWFGTANTVILMTSSLTMVVAERATEEALRGLARCALCATIWLGLAFLVVKGFEYREDIAAHLLPGPGFRLPNPHAQQFWAFYWTATIVHAVHLTLGLGIVARLLVIDWISDLPRQRTAVQGSALYWHLVDIVWVILYPLLYLVGRP